jgi:hypothetical protein
MRAHLFQPTENQPQLVFAGQNVGVKQLSENIWPVSFMGYDLGYFDDETCRLEPLENPFGPKVVTHLSGTTWALRNGEELLLHSWHDGHMLGRAERSTPAACKGRAFGARD